MSWISGNLNEAEGPIVKENSLYICAGMPNQTDGEECYLVIVWPLYAFPSRKSLHCSS